MTRGHESINKAITVWVWVFISKRSGTGPEMTLDADPIFGVVGTTQVVSQGSVYADAKSC